MDRGKPPTVIVGRVGRRRSNALVMTFDDGIGPPIATAVQSAGDGFGMKLKMLFGLANHGPGRHVTTLAAGSTIVTTSRMRGLSVISRDGHEIASVSGTSRNEKVWGFDYSTVTGPDGVVLFTVVSDPDRPNTMDLHCMLLLDAKGEPLGSLDVVLGTNGWLFDVGSWGLPGVLGDVAGLASVGGGGLSDLPIVMKGTRLVLRQPPTEPEREVLLGICVDLAICGRNYIRWKQATLE